MQVLVVLNEVQVHVAIEFFGLAIKELKIKSF